MSLSNDSYFTPYWVPSKKRFHHCTSKRSRLFYLKVPPMASSWSIKLLKGPFPQPFQHSALEKYKVISRPKRYEGKKISSLSIKMSRCFIRVPVGPGILVLNVRSVEWIICMADPWPPPSSLPQAEQLSGNRSQLYWKIDWAILRCRETPSILKCMQKYWYSTLFWMCFFISHPFSAKPYIWNI